MYICVYVWWMCLFCVCAHLCMCAWCLCLWCVCAVCILVIVGVYTSVCMCSVCTYFMGVCSFVCDCVCVWCIYLSLWVCVHLCVSVWGAKVDIRCLCSISLYLYFLSQGLSQNLEVPDSSRSAGNEFYLTVSSFLCGCWGTSLAPCAFTVGASAIELSSQPLIETSQGPPRGGTSHIK